jgi:hypothetical protein
VVIPVILVSDVRDFTDDLKHTKFLGIGPSVRSAVTMLWKRIQISN